MPYFDAGTSGLTGTVGVTVYDAAGTLVAARTTSGITELVAGSGVYHVADNSTTATRTYVWDTGVGTIGASETLYADPALAIATARDAVIAALPDIPPPDDGVTITPETLDVDGTPLGAVMPLGVIRVYLGGRLEYEFDADGNGAYSFPLPKGQPEGSVTWMLRARRAGLFRDEITEVRT